MKNLFKKSKKGFTIVELVIVVAVIGILSAILIPTFTNLTASANAAKQQADLSNAYSQYTALYIDHSGAIKGQSEVKLSLKAAGDHPEKDYWKFNGEKWVNVTNETAAVITIDSDPVAADVQNGKINGYYFYY